MLQFNHFVPKFGGRDFPSFSMMLDLSRQRKMTKNNPLFSKEFPQDEDIIIAIKRIKLRRKLFRVIAYKLENGETAITTRQMVTSVKKPLYTAQEYIRKTDIQVIKVQMLNRSVTEMVYTSVVLDFWKSLNESGKGNALTIIGQQYLDEYLNNSSM
ncbi:hypothetical protein [Calothrix sp. PCC 6303]|uniref:hypothetical protein n=1 Tax=Calothrix sp. PCC 6303 TaxID=1170562 RepID=UPI001181A823|nr:hypothetical protein [Calothrix sp. PCC 6303]